VHCCVTSIGVGAHMCVLVAVLTMPKIFLSLPNLLLAPIIEKGSDAVHFSTKVEIGVFPGFCIYGSRVKEVKG